LLSISFNLRKCLSLVFLFLLPLVTVRAQDFSTDPAAKLLPNKLGDFRAASPVQAIERFSIETDAERNRIDSWAKRDYVSQAGGRFSVTLITTGSDSGAYAMLSESRRRAESFTSEGATGDAQIGTAGFSLWDGRYNNLSFFKGRVFATVKEDGESRGTKELTDFAKLFAETLDSGEGEIPVLVKHLPYWEDARRLALYVVSVDTLKRMFGDHAVFSVVDFGGGAEAVTANYGTSRMVIIEFNTPQLATDNHGRITAKLQELSNQGQPVPTAYRRVGNYSVFVFDAPSQEAANSLIDKVKYEQMVQWLGKNPYLYERALREFSQTTLGVFVNVVKGSGLALVSCLAIGGLLGGILFVRRRAQQRAVEAYSDSGGLLRLNLDEMTPEIEPGRLLGPGK